MLFLVTNGITLNFTKLEKLHLKDQEYIVINNEDIQSEINDCEGFLKNVLEQYYQKNLYHL